MTKIDNIGNTDNIDKDDFDEDEWIRNAIEGDMIGTAKVLGKKYHTIMVMYYKVESIGDGKLLKIQMDSRMYNVLRMYGADFDNFVHGLKLFEDDREEFMDKAKRAGWIVDIVDIRDVVI